MSQAVRGALAILVVLLLISVGVAVFSLMQKQTLEQQNQSLQSQISEFQNKESELLSRAKKLEKDAQDLNSRISRKDKEKEQAHQMYEELKTKSDELSNEVMTVAQERDDWKERLETIRKERDNLMDELKNRPEKIVYKEREPDPAAIPAAAPAAVAAAPVVTDPQGDQYWADVLKQKAALQLEVDQIKSELNQSLLQVSELKKQNSDFQLEIKKLADEKEDIQRKIKYGEDLANSLSIEVARAQTDRKFVNERAEKLKEENLALQDQIKQLSSTKLALERSIASLSDQKVIMERKLADTEGVIQGRINEIWQMKDNLDKKIADMPVKSGSSSEVELPPIIVNATATTPVEGAVKAAKTQGAIISINESNNFVIVDWGEMDGNQVGRQLRVFRGNNQIATLEVIQVRKDIAAADIKQKSSKLKVGDIVR